MLKVKLTASRTRGSSGSRRKASDERRLPVALRDEIWEREPRSMGWRTAILSVGTPGGSTASRTELTLSSNRRAWQRFSGATNRDAGLVMLQPSRGIHPQVGPRGINPPAWLGRRGRT